MRFDTKTLCVPAYSGTDLHLFFGSNDILFYIKYPVFGNFPKSAFLRSLSPVEKLQSLSDEEWTVFLYQLCSSLEQSASTAPPPLPPPPPPHSTTNRSRLNLLCYLCCVVGHKVIANRLMNSPLVGQHVFRSDPC